MFMPLLIYFFIYFLTVFVIRSIFLWRKTGINPFTFDNTDDAHSYNGQVFKLVIAIELITIGCNAFEVDWYCYLLPFWYLESVTLSVVGWTLLLASLVFVWVAQIHMANSWRIGIDEKNESKLVTNGLFSISRNPIFLSVVISNLGLFLVIPNAITLLVVSFSIITTNTQIRLEEAFLKQRFGSEYEQYKQRVRRWL